MKFHKDTKFKLYLSAYKDPYFSSMLTNANKVMKKKSLSKGEKAYLNDLFKYRHNSININVVFLKSFDSPIHSQNGIQVMIDPDLPFLTVIALEFKWDQQDFKFLLALLSEAKEKGYVTYKTLTRFHYEDSLIKPDKQHEIVSSYFLYRKGLSYQEISTKYKEKIENSLLQTKIKRRLAIVRQHILYDFLNLYIPVTYLNQKTKYIWPYVKDKIQNVEEIEKLYSLNTKLKTIKLSDVTKSDRVNNCSIYRINPKLFKYWYSKPKFELAGDSLYFRPEVRENPVQIYVLPNTNHSSSLQMTFSTQNTMEDYKEYNTIILDQNLLRNLKRYFNSFKTLEDVVKFITKNNLEKNENFFIVCS